MPDAAKVAGLETLIATCQVTIKTYEADLKGYRQRLAEELCPFEQYDILQSEDEAFISACLGSKAKVLWVSNIGPHPYGERFCLDTCEISEAGQPSTNGRAPFFDSDGLKKVGHLTPEQIQIIESGRRT